MSIAVAAFGPQFLRSGYTARVVEVGLSLGGDNPTVAAANTTPRATNDEADLVDAIARGESGALETVYERHGRAVYSMALHLLSDSSSAEEVVQETFIKLWRQPSAYQPARGRLFPWLLGVAHHHAVDLLRRRQLEQRHRIDSIPTASGDGLTDLIDTRGPAAAESDPQLRAGALEDQVVVGRALAALPPEQRIPLELAYYKGLTQVEIAAVLGAPLGTIKTRMRLGLQQLRKTPDLTELWGNR